MDKDNEIARAKWLLISVAIFLLSGCLSWGELTYLIAGRDGEATVVKAYEVTRRGRTHLTVDYAFTEPDGTARKGTDSVSTDWAVPPGGKVLVRYTAGADGSCRLTGNVNWLALALFGLSVGSMGLFGYRLWREGVEATRDEKPKRRRTRFDA